MSDDNQKPNPDWKDRSETFIPLPSDPKVKLTQEQLDMLFPPKKREVFIRELFRITQKAMNDEETIPPVQG